MALRNSVGVIPKFFRNNLLKVGTLGSRPLKSIIQRNFPFRECFAELFFLRVDYLDYLGFEMVTLENYEEIYKGLLEV